MIKYLSYSSINLYLTCGEAWKRRYLLKERTSTSPALVFGSAFHGTVEAAIENRMEGLDGDTTHRQIWDAQWQLATNQEVDWSAEKPEALYNDGLRLVQSEPVQKLIGRIEPLRDDQGLFMERKITLNVPGVPVPVIGYIDVVTKDGIPGDFKTSARKWSKDKVAAELQPLFYLAGMSQMGMKVPDFRFRHYVITKTKEPVVQTLSTKHSAKELFWLYDVIQRVWNGIVGEIYQFAQPGSWKCAEKYCEFWSTCKGQVVL